MPTATTAAAYSPISAHKKFSSFTGLGQLANRTTHDPAASGATTAIRTSVKGLFDNVTNVSASGGLSASASTKPNLNPQSASKEEQSHHMARSSDGPWSISVAEAKDKREGRKRKQVQASYTLYVTTPTHNLTLTRSAAEIVQLDQKVRDGQSLIVQLPTLPTLPSSSPQTSGRKLLQTISRTLSPSGNRYRNHFAGMGLEPQSPGSSTADTAAVDVSPPPSAPLSPNMDGTFKLKSHPTTTQLATYLTTISNVPSVRAHKAWKRFVRVGTDDLESIRVERRVRKVRSDLAQHVASSVAPKNTNVGADVSHSSQSDLGECPEEEGADDEMDQTSSSQDARRSSSSRQEPSIEEPSTPNGADAPHVPARSSSVRRDSSSVAEKSESATESIRPTSIIDIIPEEKISDSNKANLPTQETQQQVNPKRRKGQSSSKVTVNDFEMIRVLGKGCAGKVLLVRHHRTKGLYAMKSIHKRHVLAHQELQHTLTEQSVLKRMAKKVTDPFVVHLWWSFHDRNNLYLVMDFHPGGDLATQLSRWGRLGRDRARFYAAEIVEGVEGLHKAGVIYRDLKPENVLIGADGHIVLSDFGLSKEFNSKQRSNGSSTPPPSSPGSWHSSSNLDENARSAAPWLPASEDGTSDVTRSMTHQWLEDRETTTTFCGTAEYLAPEVLQGQPYSYEVDWWSFGTMLYEMLTGITPFWADTHADMYARVLRDPLVFPEDRVLDGDTKSIIRGLLQRNPLLRMKEPRIKKHPYFSMIEWGHIFHKRYIPPYVPPIDPHNEVDTQNFDETFLEMQPTVAHNVDAEGNNLEDENGENVDKTLAADNEGSVGHVGDDPNHLFDGYSFRARRDSESVKSAIISTIENPAAGDENINTSGTMPADSTNAVSAPQPIEEEDDESAARAAVAALAHLENEASMEASIATTCMTQSDSTQPGSSAPSREATSNGTVDSEPSLTSHRSPSPASSYTGKPAIKPTLSAGGQPTNGAIRELDDEDEDWDMVEASGPGGELKSEINGSRGANLFARGVVDTYRLLRRQDSSRLPNSSSHGSTSSRAFNRMGKRRNNLHGTKPWTGNVTSASAQSLESRERNDGHGLREPISDTSKLGGIAASPSVHAARKNAASPSLSGSEENKHQTRMKKIKRFTTFFEPTSHR